MHDGSSTEAKRAHEQLAAERDRLDVTLRSIGDAVITTDEAGRVTMLNGVAEELTGWKSGECIGADIHEVFEIVHEETRQRAANPVDRALAEGVVVGLANHTSLIARDGTERPIADSAAPIRNASGHIVGVVLVFRDQTKERRAEQALRDSEQRVRLKLDSILSPEGDIGNLQLGDIVDAAALQSMMEDFHRILRIPMAIIDVEGKILVGVGWQDICTKFHRAHPETCKHCIESDTQLNEGVRPGEIRLYKCKNNMWDALTPITVGGHHLGNVFTGQFFFDDEWLDRELFRSQARRYQFNQEAYLAALESVPRLSRACVADGMAFLAKFAGMLSQLSFSNIKLARSVAEREALMSSLQANKARLEEEDRKKNEFLAVLSHELRNPLAPIRNSVHILHRAPPGSDQAIRAQNVIERQAGHLTRLVDDLLDVARIARGRIELRRTRTDLREVVLRAADDFRAMMDERGLTFHVEVPATRAWADLDATRVTQVIGNLLHNAAKFASRGDEVSLSLRVANGQGVISVRDTGPGIDPALLPIIFDTFVQEERTLARSSGGLGLGLPLVKSITELHGGTVCAESAGVDKGAQFTVVMPLAPAAASQEAERPVVVRRLTPRRVLIVDDNRDSADSMADIVEMLGHVAEVAYDGPSAIEKARASAPHVVLCDIGLPGMSGYEVARALRAGATNAMQLIAVTGYAHPDDVKEAVAAGFDGHVAKPASADAIERLLG